MLYTDADLPFDMDELIKACRVLRHYDADLVSAYRLDRTGEGYIRSMYSTIYNVLVRVLFGVRVRDINFAFKLCRRSVLDHMTLVSEGSFIDAELVVRAHKLGFNIVQFGVDYFPRTRGVSTLSSPARDRHDPAGDVGAPAGAAGAAARRRRPGEQVPVRAGLRGVGGGPLVRWAAAWPPGGSGAPGREPTDRSGAATCHLSTPPPCADGRRLSWRWWRSRGWPAGGRSSGPVTTKRGAADASTVASTFSAPPPETTAGAERPAAGQAAAGPGAGRGSDRR